LADSDLIAECPCGGEFRLSSAFLFDGTKPFPPEGIEVQTRLKDGLREREMEMKKKRKLATVRSQNTTKSVNVGKVLEKILPTMRDFKWTMPDSRFLGEPIDFIVFNGLAGGRVMSIDFVEVKSGAGKLNGHQKSIKQAIEDGDVAYEVFK
jgi:predicted Holliday junction resolvase-like endonuclease